MIHPSPLAHQQIHASSCTSLAFNPIHPRSTGSVSKAPHAESAPREHFRPASGPGCSDFSLVLVPGTRLDCLLRARREEEGCAAPLSPRAVEKNANREVYSQFERMSRALAGMQRLSPRYCAAIQANTQAVSSSLSAGRASGMGEPQGGVGESF